MDSKQRFYLLDALAKEVKAAADKAKKELEAGGMLPGDRSGIEFTLPDGSTVDLGAVTRTKPVPAWKVTDPDAYAEWVEANHPEAITYAPVVKEWFTASILAMAKENDAAISAAGELIPGIEKTAPGSYVGAKPSRDAKDGIRALQAAGAFTMTDLLGIEA